MGRIKNINDIIGNTYGKLEVVGYLGCYAEFTDEHRMLRQVYLCKCDLILSVIMFHLIFF